MKYRKVLLIFHMRNKTPGTHGAVNVLNIVLVAHRYHNPLASKSLFPEGGSDFLPKTSQWFPRLVPKIVFSVMVLYTNK